jgi:hypothetical protein
MRTIQQSYQHFTEAPFYIQPPSLTMTTPQPQHGEVKTFARKLCCSKCNREPTINIPYTWDSENKLRRREFPDYYTECSECTKVNPSSAPGEIIVKNLPRWKIEVPKDRKKDGDGESQAMQGFISFEAVPP